MYHLNISINAYIIVFTSIFIFHTYSLQYSDEDLDNVGSVLFTSSDLNKKRWYRTNIELLQARRYFQNIIPSPRSVDALNEDYISGLLKYFANAFSAVKKEDLDPDLINILEKALSDTIGGYLKLWVLPVTKFAYYGGTVSQDKAIEAFELYESLKKSLNTNGSGWRNPSKRLLNSIAVNVIPYSHVPNRRSMSDPKPCEHLAYYEKTPKGMTIPMPCINWDDLPYTMFLPLKNESVIRLNSPKSSNALLKYYEIAENCCQSDDPDGCSDLDLRFQHWLYDSVVPHLNDDKLYIAFGGLLGLLSQNKNLYDKVSLSDLNEYEYDDKYTCLKTSILSRLPPCMTSKKFLILVIILFVEIIWCIPAVLYIICSRKKRHRRSTFIFDVFKRDNGKKYQTVGRIDKNSKSNFINQKHLPIPNKMYRPRIMDTGLRLFQKPRTKNLDIDTQCPSQNSKHSIGQVTETFSDIINNAHVCDCQSVTLINEKSMKSSLKKISIDAIKTSHVQTRPTKQMSTTNQIDSFVRVHQLETTITKIKKDKSGCNSKSCMKIASIIDNNKRICSEVKQRLQDLRNKEEVNNVDPCTCCLEEGTGNKDHLHIKNVQEALPIVSSKASKNLQETSKVRKEIDSKRRVSPPKLQTKVSNPKNLRLNNSKGLKLNTGEPLLEIRIDKPATEITVDVMQHKGKNTKPSKIPKRTTNCTFALVGNLKEDGTDGRKKLNAKAKSVRNRCLDDSHLTTRNVRDKNVRVQRNMNVTL